MSIDLLLLVEGSVARQACSHSRGIAGEENRFKIMLGHGKKKVLLSCGFQGAKSLVPGMFHSVAFCSMNRIPPCITTLQTHCTGNSKR